MAQKITPFLWFNTQAEEAAEQCGWLQDKYGVSWQIVPSALNEMMSDKDPEKARKATEAMLKMKKFDMRKLTRAYEGK
jgi:predicted 3-demethylubiquinone-9 3-methyltransferase (glyoxalase superfamily)